MGYREDREWADNYLDQVANILRRNAAHLMDVQIAPDDVDRETATDMVLRLSGGDVAVRLRRADCRYRDLTIRSHRETGYRTELSKIEEGFGDWYLYGWLNKQDKVAEWILVDLDRLRKRKLWLGRHDIPNGDGTWFIAISSQELRKTGCLIAEQLGQQARLF